MRKGGMPNPLLAIFQHFGLFSAFFPLSVDLAPGVRFGQTWYLRKTCDVYFPMSQISYHSEFWLRNCGLEIRATRVISLLAIRFSVLILGWVTRGCS